ncbi:MAG: PLP-dependent transferase [Chlamydiia bacterium]|nr:PLP-dependent transferase [Chlamydiia bacterium]
MHFMTKAIHVGSEPEKETGAVIPPIYLTSTFAQEYPCQHHGYEYTRAGNPNFSRLEDALAALEEARHATVFSSGLGALSALLSSFEQGDHIVTLNGLYGGTYRLFAKVFSRFGITFESVSPEELPAALSRKPKCFLFETPTNPLLEIFDIEELTAIAKRHGVMVVVDNTFATPFFQNPLRYGADVVWHSATKYIGGHSDVIGGAMMTNDKALKEALDFARMAVGVNPSPFDAWLLTRSIKTLGLRMERHQHNAFEVARFLEDHPLVARVYYPGLRSHPQHEIAKKQMRGFSGIVSTEFKLSLEETKQVISRFKYITLAESLGGVESLVDHPASMTHASIPPEERERIGIAEGLVRFSIGVEDSHDLIADLKTALDAIGQLKLS